MLQSEYFAKLEHYEYTAVVYSYLTCEVPGHVLDGPARRRPRHSVDVHDFTHKPLGVENEEEKEGGE